MPRTLVSVEAFRSDSWRLEIAQQKPNSHVTIEGLWSSEGGFTVDYGLRKVERPPLFHFPRWFVPKKKARGPS